MSASHVRARRLDALTAGLSLVIALAGMASTVVTSITSVVTAVGAIWAFGNAVGVARLAEVELRRAVVIQEMFDRSLFGIPWNTVLAGNPVGAPEISRLSARYRGHDDMVHHYYEARALPAPLDVLTCQIVNLGWGARVRRRLVRIVAAVLTAWSAAGLLLGVLTDMSIGQILLRWYVPSLSGVMLGLDVIRCQVQAVRERSRLRGCAQKAMADLVAASHGVGPVTDDLSRVVQQLQDAIFIVRTRCPRVPDWIFMRSRARDRADFGADVDAMERVLGGVRREPLQAH
jgi:hypothetical protein